MGGEKPKLSIESLNLKTGLWALIGRNGAGKSTFLNALSGVTVNFEGEILIQNQNLKNIQARDLAKQIAVVYSKSTLFGNHTALDILYLGRIPYQGLMATISEEDKKIVNEIITILKLDKLIHKPFSVLSDGEKQLVMIGRALVQNTPIILLDEPTAFLDVVNRKKIISLLSKVAKEQDKTIIFSTHNMDLVEMYCDGILMILDSKMKTITSKKEFKNQIEKLFIDEV